MCLKFINDLLVSKKIRHPTIKTHIKMNMALYKEFCGIINQYARPCFIMEQTLLIVCSVSASGGCSCLIQLPQRPSQ